MWIQKADPALKATHNWFELSFYREGLEKRLESRFYEVIALAKWLERFIIAH